MAVKSEMTYKGMIAGVSPSPADGMMGRETALKMIIAIMLFLLPVICMAFTGVCAG